MLPNEDAIARVMHDTGMEKMQAINHLRGCAAVSDNLDRARRCAPNHPAPRSYATSPFRSFLPPGSIDRPQELTRLRVYGSGVSCIAGGNPGTYRDAAEAEQRGEVWVITGVQPADQRD